MGSSVRLTCMTGQCQVTEPRQSPEKTNSKNRAGEGERERVLFMHVGKVFRETYIFVKLPGQFPDINKWVFNNR